MRSLLQVWTVAVDARFRRSWLSKNAIRVGAFHFPRRGQGFRIWRRSRNSYLDRGHSCPPHVCRIEENERTRMSAVLPNPAPLFHMRSPCRNGEVPRAARDGCAGYRGDARVSLSDRQAPHPLRHNGEDAVVSTVRRVLPRAGEEKVPTSSSSRRSARRRRPPCRLSARPSACQSASPRPAVRRKIRRGSPSRDDA